MTQDNNSTLVPNMVVWLAHIIGVILARLFFPLQMLSQDEGAVACPKPVIVMVVMEPSCVVKQHDSARWVQKRLWQCPCNSICHDYGFLSFQFNQQTQPWEGPGFHWFLGAGDGFRRMGHGHYLGTASSATWLWDSGAAETSSCGAGGSAGGKGQNFCTECGWQTQKSTQTIPDIPF